jgi:hypothetical protein
MVEEAKRLVKLPQGSVNTEVQPIECNAWVGQGWSVGIDGSPAEQSFPVGQALRQDLNG